MSDYKPLTPAEVQEWESILLNDKTKSIAANNALEMVCTIKAQDNQLQAAMAYVKSLEENKAADAAIIKIIKSATHAAMKHIFDSDFKSAIKVLNGILETSGDIT